MDKTGAETLDKFVATGLASHTSPARCFILPNRYPTRGDTMTTRGRRRLAALGLGAVIALTTTGCLQPKDSGGSSAGLDGYVDNAQSDGDGKVTILGAFAPGRSTAPITRSAAATAAATFS